MNASDWFAALWVATGVMMLVHIIGVFALGWSFTAPTFWLVLALLIGESIVGAWMS